MRILPVAALFAVTALLAGCGGGSSSAKDNGVADKTAKQIVAAATVAAKNASSVWVHGSGTDGSAPLELDMHLVKGKGGAGHIVVNGQNVDIVTKDGKAYIKGDDAFWKQFGGDAAVSLLHGRWLMAPSTDATFGSFAELTDLEKFFEGVLGSHADVKKGEETDVNGTPAIAVEDPAQSGTLYVATQGEPYPLKIATNGDKNNSIAFDDWNKDYTIEAPKDAVDVSKLTGG